MSRRRHWYHCTQDRACPTWTATRRPPITRSASEPMTPRLCVSDSAARALDACWWTRDVSVYVTEERRTVPPSGVFDAVFTGERWIIPPVRLNLVGVIPFHAIDEAQDGLEPWSTDIEYEGWNRRSIKLRKMSLVVREHLPHVHERWVEKFAESCARLFQRKVADSLREAC